MRNICLYFQIHQPVRLKRYRFFNIGNDHYYYDDYLNESIISRLAVRSYLHANKVIRKIIKEYGSQFKVAFSISGVALDQLELYSPEKKSIIQGILFREKATPCRKYMTFKLTHPFNEIVCKC